jgi:SEL1 protein
MKVCLTRVVSSEVQQAWADLKALQNTNRRFWRFSKKSGLVGSTVYYAKKGFILLFMNGPRQSGFQGSNVDPSQLSKPLAKAIKTLERAANEHDPDALFLLAEMNFYGNFTHPRNYKEAFRRYEELASLNGNSSAQYMIGFMYATGIGGAVERDQGKALLYHTFAAKGGDVRSEMTTAYRHHSGIGAPRNCNEAAVYYKKVADKAIEYARSGPPGGMNLPKEARRIADEFGGVYGEGASWSSSGVNSKNHGPNSDQNAAFDDLMEYLDLMSRKGDLKATFNLGRLYYEGSHTMKRNYKTARQYFLTVARSYWSSDNTVISQDIMGTGKLAAKAAAYLGTLYLRGEGVEQNYAKAIRWFRLGLENGEAFCQYEVGLVYLHGLGVTKDPLTAADYFKAAAKQDWPAAQVQLGKLFLDQGDLSAAVSYFELGARHHHIEAYYHLAEINNNGVGRERSCGMATAYYKLVAEKVEPLHSSFEEANNAYEEGDLETALVAYMMAAEQGYEQAQANVAYLLDEQKSIFSLDGLLPWKAKRPSILKNPFMALVYWTRSAKQTNIDSAVKMGDYYLNGYGVEAEPEKAATCYQAAAEMQQSAQAAWNLGWMHENGIGVEQDFHLAMRFYMQALETNSESYVPVKLSLFKLRWRNWWNTITRGDVNPIHPEPGMCTFLYIEDHG